MQQETNKQPSPINKLRELMAILRNPEIGCSWDIAQTPATIVPYTIEEAYEVADAVERENPEDLRDELGDLLLQVVFQAQMAEETGFFDFDAVAGGIVEKLIRRHPHVFEPDGTVQAPERRCSDPLVIETSWRRIKAEEQAMKAVRNTVPATTGLLDGIPTALPALIRAEKVSRKAAGYGFDWPNTRDVLAKIREETDEVEQSLLQDDSNAITEEIGDLLFSVANLARHAGIDPEEALRRGTRKFERRFTAMAIKLANDGGSLSDANLSAMEAAWQAVKRAEV